MTGLPDPTRSRAVLIGVRSYLFLADLPAVRNNVERLASLFTDPRVWGLPASHCVALHDPQSGQEVLDAVHEAAARAEDALVVYFAGHGLLSPNADLYLALPGSDPRRLYRSVDYDLLRHEIVDDFAADPCDFAQASARTTPRGPVCRPPSRRRTGAGPMPGRRLPVRRLPSPQRAP
ncbi:caspase family protein [Streptomyces sp. NBC_01314]|uniref:caspase family protein n=1 Tax=Streptomyces sp. NBC_01314 TaxID=2903821 RepID=UPI0030853D83|nr:caspase family protein [Streptomyces sp. NBC_01314]